MALVCAVVAGNIQHAHQTPLGILNRRGTAGEEGIAFEKVFGAEDIHGVALGQRRADGVGSAFGLVPVGARTQRDLLGLTQEIGIAIALQQHAPRIGKHNHAMGVTDLLEEVLQNRLGVGQ